ncbi:DUF4907 domain-containing protein [Chitinophaga lutea]
MLFAATLLSCHDRKAALQLTAEPSGDGWGYRITRQGKPLIYQPLIPAVRGHHPFRSKSDALRTGTLVLQKLGQGRLPAVTTQELDSLGVRPF